MDEAKICGKSMFDVLCMTKSEKQVMGLLWSVDRPLSCSEIVELSRDKVWKDSYVHSLIKSLMKKSIVKIESFELISRSYARKFSPAMSKAEYAYGFLVSTLSRKELMQVVELLKKWGWIA